MKSDVFHFQPAVDVNRYLCLQKHFLSIKLQLFCTFQIKVYILDNNRLKFIFIDIYIILKCSVGGPKLLNNRQLFFHIAELLLLDPWEVARVWPYWDKPSSESTTERSWTNWSAVTSAKKHRRNVCPLSAKLKIAVFCVFFYCNDIQLSDNIKLR